MAERAVHALREVFMELNFHYQLNLDIAKICCKKTELHNLHSMFGPYFCIDVWPIKLSQY